MQKGEIDKNKMFKFICQWQNSNKTIKLFCVENNISIHKFNYWKKHFHKSTIDADIKPKFIEITAEHLYSSSFGGIEVITNNGYIINFKDAVSASFLKQLIS